MTRIRSHARRQLHRFTIRQLLANPDYHGVTILTTDLEYSDITRGKFDFDVTGHYARPDTFRLCVSERKMKPISDSVDALADPFAE